MNRKQWYKDNDYKITLKDYIIKKNRISYILDGNNLPPELDLSFRKTPVYHNGEKHNKITMLYPCGVDRDGRVIYVCVCDCGTYFLGSEKRILDCTTKSCGCLHREIVTEMNVFVADASPIKEIGKTYGQLKVIKFLGYEQRPNGKRRSKYLCICHCGRICEKYGVYLRSGETKSCGLCGMNSIGEMKIASWLDKYGIIYQPQYSFEDCLSDKGNKLYFDFAIFQNSQLYCLLEYDGAQHYVDEPRFTKYFGPYEERHRRDLIKNNYCAQQEIPLYRIRFDDDIELKMGNILAEIAKT